MKIKISNVLIFKSITLILFFSTVINYYILPTVVFTELFSVFLCCYGFFVQKNKVNKEIYLTLLFVFLSISICILAVIKGGGQFDDAAKETYRFFSISFIFLALFTVDIPYKEVFKFILLLCKIYVFYNIYEVVYINLIAFGKVEGLIFGKGILAYYNDSVDSQYFLPQTEFIIPFIRPYGLWFQPQKSAFIFPIAIIVLHIYDKYFEPVKRKNLWAVLFILSTIIAGTKTALLTSLFVFTVANIHPPKRVISLKQFIGYLFIAVLGVAIFFYVTLLANFDESNSSASAFSRDLNAFFKINFVDQLFGLGFISDDKMRSMDFAGEVFIIRVLSQIGILNFLLCLLLSIRIFFDKLNREILLVIILGIYMVIHYAIINIYFFTFVICLIIHFKKRGVKHNITLALHE